MSFARRLIAVSSLVVALGASGLAQEAGEAAATPTPLTAQDTAAEAIRRAAEDNPKGLAELARRVAVDPWLVADALCARGAFDTAEAFCSASAASRRGGVLTFIAGQREVPTPKARRAALADAGRASANRRPTEAVAIIDRAGFEGSDVISIRLRMARAAYIGQQGDAAAALVALLELEPIVRELDWPTRLADVCEYVAVHAERARNFELADRYWEKAAVQFRTLPSTRDEARTLHGLARLRFQQNQFGEALRAMRRALPVILATKDRHYEGVALSALGVYEYSAGDLAAAASHHERALHILGANPNSVVYARAVLEAARTQLALGEREAAILMTTAALDALPAVELPISTWEDGQRETIRGSLLLLRSSAHQEEAERETALNDAISAGQAFANARRPRSAADAKGREVELRLLSGDKLDVQKEYETILQSAGELGDPLLEMRAHITLGMLRAEVKDDIGALEHFGEARTRASAHGLVSDHALCLRFMAASQLRAGKTSEALATARSALKIDLRSAQRLGVDESQTLARSFWNALVTGLAAATIERDLSSWFDMAESGRGRALAESVGGRGAMQAARVSDDLLAALGAAEVGLATATQRVAEARASGELAAIRAAVKVEVTAKERHRHLLDRIERRKKLAAELDTLEPPTLTDVQKRLGKGRALVLFHVAPDPTPGSKLASQALVVTNADVRLVDLGARDAFMASCNAVRFDGGADAKAVDAARAAIIGVLKLDKEIRTLLVVPDGPLATVPFALLDPSRDVAIVPSSLVWTLLDDNRADVGNGVLAIGNPDYAGTRMAPLPKTEAEVTTVGTRVLIDKEATEAAVRTAVVSSPRWRAVHFACHGVLDKRHASLSGLALTRADQDDGRLTAREILGMSIPADLAVLSACQAGRPGKPGEDNVSAATGIPPAFLAAGCSRVIANLWKVDDEAARVFSVALHAEWAKPGISAAQALRSARAAVRADSRFSDARHWAGWVLWGVPD